MDDLIKVNFFITKRNLRTLMKHSENGDAITLITIILNNFCETMENDDDKTRG